MKSVGSVNNRELSDIIKMHAGTLFTDIVGIQVCTVNSVDMDAQTCDCTPITGDSDAEIPNIQLSAEPDDMGFILFPEVGSTVIVGMSQKNIPFILMYSAIDTAYLITDTLTRFNDGSYGGLVKVIELTNKINALENLVNNILNTLKTTTIPLAPSGTYPFAPLYASLSDITPITQRGDIENTTITHGK